MKKLYRPLCFVAAVAAMSLTSCQKENFNPAGDGETVTITVHANVEDVANATKTHIEGTQVLWDENEEMKVIAFNNADPENTGSESVSTEFTPSADFTTATFKAAVSEGKNPDRIAGVYPADAAVGLGSVYGQAVNATSYKVELSAAQSATADSYDPASYIMIARADAYPLENGEWTAYYKRVTALNCMTLSGITDEIKSVTVTFPEGQQAAGRRYYNLATGEAGEIYHEPTNVVTVNYATPLKAGNGENDVWFTSWNVNVKTGESITVKAESATKIYTKTLTATKKDVALMENYLNTFPFDMTGAEVETIETDDNIIYSNTFAIGEGDFTIDNKVINAPLTYVWSNDDRYECMKASAFVSGTNYESESWLISPVIDLTSKTEAYLTFEHATNFFNVEGSVEDEATVWAKKDGDSEWTKLSGITYPSSQGWTFVDAGDIDLSAFTGTKMQFAFVYKSSSSQSGTWEIKNVVVKNHIEAYCEVTPLALNVSAEAGTTTFNISSNEYWMIESNNPAYTVSPEEGTGNATITITYPANESEEPVEVSFTVLSDSGIENTVVLSQMATGVELLTITLDASTKPCDDFPEGSTGKNTTETYTIGDYEWTFSPSSGNKFSWYSQNYILWGKNGAYILLPAVEGKKLTNVTILTGANASTKVRVGVYTEDGTSPVIGGEDIQLNKQNTEFTWALNGTENNTHYQLRVCSNHNAQLQKLTLIYE